MDIWVYIIKTHRGTFYTGMTNSIIRRWQEHLCSKRRYMGIYKAKMVLHLERFDSYKLARFKEVYIQRKGAKKYLLSLYYSKSSIDFYLNDLI